MEHTSRVSAVLLFFFILLVDHPSRAQDEQKCLLVDDAEDSVTSAVMSCWSYSTEPGLFSLDGSFGRLIGCCEVQGSTESENRTVLHCNCYQPGAYTCQCTKNGPKSNAIIKPALDVEDPNQTDPAPPAQLVEHTLRAKENNVSDAPVPTVVIVVGGFFAGLVLLVPVAWILLRRKYRNYKDVSSTVVLPPLGHGNEKSQVVAARETTKV